MGAALTGVSVFEEIESEVRAYCRNWPTVFDRAQGSYVYDRSGRAYLDYFTGVATLSYGHNHPVLKHALIDYIQRDGLMHSLDTYTVAKEGFLERFGSHILAPRGLDYKVLFPAPTGTNAVEAALKLAARSRVVPASSVSPTDSTASRWAPYRSRPTRSSGALPAFPWNTPSCSRTTATCRTAWRG
jgi:acetylornithine/succinyldiaminopimelate/putrescine aminotransferase